MVKRRIMKILVVLFVVIQVGGMSSFALSEEGLPPLVLSLEESQIDDLSWLYEVQDQMVFYLNHYQGEDMFIKAQGEGFDLVFSVEEAGDIANVDHLKLLYLSSTCPTVSILGVTLGMPLDNAESLLSKTYGPYTCLDGTLEKHAYSINGHKLKIISEYKKFEDMPIAKRYVKEIRYYEEGF